MVGLKVGYWAAQEQYDPETLLRNTRHAEVVGFDMIVTSDHFHPWRDSGHAALPWIWLAVAASQTKVGELGTAVTTPFFRYHPAIVAQAFATLDNIFPGRIFVTLGTGHKMNEFPLGYDWPDFGEKVKRLEEAVEIIRALWTQEFVDYKGEYYQLRKAKMYTKPKKKIPIFLATSNPKVASIAGRLGDGILTNPRGLDNHMKLIKSMKSGSTKAGRDPSKLDVCMEFKVSYDVDYDRALEGASYWAPTAIPRTVREHISDPRELEEKVGQDEINKVRETWLVTTKSDDIIKRLGEFLKMGFSRVYIHSASPNEQRFLDLLGRDILPWMREYYETLTNPLRILSE